ncbi:MAG: hypothetical protein Q9180_009896, partial [Flavoplaca navasiana]
MFLRGSGRRIKMSDTLDSLASKPDHGGLGYQEQSNVASDPQSTVENHSHGKHGLYE